MSGNVSRVVAEKDIFVVRPRGEGPVHFRYRPERFEVTLDGEQAKPEDIESGQAASVEYKTRETSEGRELNLARSVELETNEGATGEETTG